MEKYIIYMMSTAVYLVRKIRSRFYIYNTTLYNILKKNLHSMYIQQYNIRISTANSIIGLCTSFSKPFWSVNDFFWWSAGGYSSAYSLPSMPVNSQGILWLFQGPVRAPTCTFQYDMICIYIYNRYKHIHLHSTEFLIYFPFHQD